MEDKNQIAADRALLERLGGAGKVCDILGFNRDGGIQRVQNWMTRGIPSKQKLARPDLFLQENSPKRHSRRSTDAPKEHKILKESP